MLENRFKDFRSLNYVASADANRGGRKKVFHTKTEASYLCTVKRGTSLCLHKHKRYFEKTVLPCQLVHGVHVSDKYIVHDNGNSINCRITAATDDHISRVEAPAVVPANHTERREVLELLVLWQPGYGVLRRELPKKAFGNSIQGSLPLVSSNKVANLAARALAARKIFNTRSDGRDQVEAKVSSRGNLGP